MGAQSVGLMTDSVSMSFCIPTEPIGSLPRRPKLVEAFRAYCCGELDCLALDRLAQQEALLAIRQLEETGSDCITDGEQRKFPGFAGYAVHDAPNVAADGPKVTFGDGHTRALPCLMTGPFKYTRSADTYLEFTKRHTNRKVKQAVVSPALLSWMYPPMGMAGYSKTQFLDDLIREHAAEVQRCLNKGADKVQIDFSEARLSLKTDDSGRTLQRYVELLNRALATFSSEERARIGVHVCAGNDFGCTHSANVDAAAVLPALFRLEVGSLYIALAAEEEPARLLKTMRDALRPQQRVFVGVTNPCRPDVESAEEVRDRLLQAADFIPTDQLGSTDDCGFSPYADNLAITRQVALDKIRARVDGTELARAELLGQSASPARTTAHA